MAKVLTCHIHLDEGDRPSLQRLPITGAYSVSLSDGGVAKIIFPSLAEHIAWLDDALQQATLEQHRIGEQCSMDDDLGDALVYGEQVPA